MKLKRLYDHSGEEPVVGGIRVLHAGPRQHFSPKLINTGIAEGWLSMGGGQVTIHGEDGPVVYRILRTPGRYGDEVINYYDCERVD